MGCENVMQEVCQQVPYRVAVPGTETIQPPPKWEMKCKWVVDKIPQCRIEYKPEEYEVPVRKCEQGQAKKCFEYKVPKWELREKQMNETVSFPTNGCNIVTKTKKHCADVPTQIDCQERNVTRTVRINKVVCDREKMARYCHRVPFSYCKNVPGQECSMEPRRCASRAAHKPTTATAAPSLLQLEVLHSARNPPVQTSLAPAWSATEIICQKNTYILPLPFLKYISLRLK